MPAARIDQAQQLMEHFGSGAAGVGLINSGYKILAGFETAAFELAQY